MGHLLALPALLLALSHSCAACSLQWARAVCAAGGSCWPASQSPTSASLEVRPSRAPAPAQALTHHRQLRLWVVDASSTPAEALSLWPPSDASTRLTDCFRDLGECPALSCRRGTCDSFAVAAAPTWNASLGVWSFASTALRLASRSPLLDSLPASPPPALPSGTGLRLRRGSCAGNAVVGLGDVAAGSSGFYFTADPQSSWGYSALSSWPLLAGQTLLDAAPSFYEGRPEARRFRGGGGVAGLESNVSTQPVKGNRIAYAEACMPLGYSDSPLFVWDDTQAVTKCGSESCEAVQLPQAMRVLQLLYITETQSISLLALNSSDTTHAVVVHVGRDRVDTGEQLDRGSNCGAVVDRTGAPGTLLCGTVVTGAINDDGALAAVAIDGSLFLGRLWSNAVAKSATSALGRSAVFCGEDLLLVSLNSTFIPTAELVTVPSVCSGGASDTLLQSPVLTESIVGVPSSALPPRCGSPDGVYGCAINHVYTDAFKWAIVMGAPHFPCRPLLLLYRGDTLVEQVLSDFVVTEDRNRSGFKYSATAKTDGGKPLGKDEAYVILNATSTNSIVWRDGASGVYRFTVQVVDPSYRHAAPQTPFRCPNSAECIRSLCLLKAHFAVDVYGQPLPKAVSLSVVFVVLAALVAALCVSYYVSNRRHVETMAVRNK
eukprot:m51a1_g6960 putative C-tail anchored protein (660) ;mRNA; r:75407-78625